jgi:tetratricopeptide (TPR) repeat protein
VIEGVALAHLHLFSAPEVAAAFERAEMLCDALPESPARARALHGLWWVNFGRGEMRRALALARRIANLGETSGDPNLQVIGCIATGSTLTHMGDFVEAQRILERGYAIFQANAQRLTPSLFVHDPGVELLSYLGAVSWWRGEPDRARETCAASLARALEIRHGGSQVIAMHFAGVLYLHDGRYEDARRIAAEGMAIVDRLALAGDGPTAHAWVHGAARVAQGDVDEGLAEMRRAAEAWTRRGMLVGLSGFYFLYGEACLMAGRYDEARQAAEDGLAFARDGAEHLLVAPLHRVLAVVRMQGGDHAGAAVALDEAITISRRQGARCFELAALLTWVQLPQIARRDAAAALRTAIEGYGPGDALPLRRARAALAELDAASAERGSAPGRAPSRR